MCVVDQPGKMIIILDHIWHKKLHYSCLLWSKKMVKDCLDSRIVKFYQTQIVGVADRCFKTITFLCYTSKRHLGRIHIMYFLISKEAFVTSLALVAIFLVDALANWRSSNWKVNHQRLTPLLTVNFRKTIICRKNRNTWHAIISLGFK